MTPKLSFFSTDLLESKTSEFPDAIFSNSETADFALSATSPIKLVASLTLAVVSSSSFCCLVAILLTRFRDFIFHRKICTICAS